MDERFVRHRARPGTEIRSGFVAKTGGGQSRRFGGCVETAARREKTNYDALKEHVRIILDSHICPVYHREGAANAA
jgi:hypothetical protein